MSLQRISVAIPITDAAIDPEAAVPMFHRWIRDNAVEGLLIDVTRYAHVPDGPGIVLIGHEGDYALDLAAGRPWLRYTLKRDNDGDVTTLVARAFDRLRHAAGVARLDGIDTHAGEVVVRIYDRMRAPNTDQTAAALTDEIIAGVGFAPARAERTSDDHREPFGLRLVAAA